MSTPSPAYLYFIGIGGIGMSGLARYFRRRGATVAGYDRTPSELIGQLRMEGIETQFDENPALIPDAFRTAQPDHVLVVRTPAVPVTSPLLKYWQERGARIVKRSELLGLVTRDRPTLAVAGTHGKTTVSTLLAHLLTAGGIPCNAFLGGISANYGTNVLLNDAARFNVVEADEYDRSFLQLHPHQAIITAMDPDHLDIYGTPEAMVEAYRQFAKACSGGLLVHERAADHVKDLPGVEEYAISPTAVHRAEHVQVKDGAYHFDLVSGPVQLRGLTLGMPGRHNVENAVAASALALRAGLSPEALRQGLASFRGVQRRFEVRARTSRSVLIDDYAHHPAELEACILSARELFPGRRITGIFQPHLFSRTRDLAEGFARSLALLDDLLLLEIYPAREEPIPGITSAWLLEQVPLRNKYLCTKQELQAGGHLREVDILLALGAGDIDRLVPHLAARIENGPNP
ncbi:MAG: UDP-N-acetylmuramate--L-alanine ligase [Flavobacteriales bacterium]|nr:UDP-N-acetylmuramate--L-alanine ligase [Flavobacteriales bacterium]